MEDVGLARVMKKRRLLPASRNYELSRYADAEALSPSRIDAPSVFHDIRAEDDTILTAAFLFLLQLSFVGSHS